LLAPRPIFLAALRCQCSYFSCEVQRD
jgi:hypothetical protein